MARSLTRSTPRPEIRLQSGPALIGHRHRRRLPGNRGGLMSPLTEESRYDLLDALNRQLATASTHPYQVCTCHMCSSGSLLPELLGETDENSFGAPDVAEPIRVFVLNHFADELRAAFAEPGERIVDVLHGEHDA